MDDENLVGSPTHNEGRHPDRNLIEHDQWRREHALVQRIGVGDEKIIYDDVEGMEHHISPETFKAIEALTRYLEKNPGLVGKARGSK